jgi:hypothetical protein
MENYVASDGTREWHYRSKGLPPVWIRAALLAGGGITCARRTTKLAPKRPGPNYDGTYNSIVAAQRYEAIRPTMLARVLAYYLAPNNRGRWIPGDEFRNKCGSSALRRSRELRETYGWPIIDRTVGQASWEYRMDLSGMQKTVTFKRRRAADPSMTMETHGSGQFATRGADIGAMFPRTPQV